MGAEPAWISLALTIPNIDHAWLTEFSESFFSILDHYNVDLIGGDTTKGPLSITITAQGIIAKDKALCRHNANVGDWIYVSGTLGDSAGGLSYLLQGKSAVNSAQEFLIHRHLRPTPRVLLGMALSLTRLASSAIDISDGCVADLTHILERSQCGAVIELDKLPLSAELVSEFGLAQAEQYALSGGEDYELCFTVPDSNKAKLAKALAHIGVNYTCIGQIRAIHPKNKNRIQFQRHGQRVEVEFAGGFDHFK